MVDLTGVPFEIPNLFFGLKSVNGVIRVREKSIILEFDEKDILGGFIKNEMHEFKIPAGELQAVTLKRGILKSTVTLAFRESIKNQLLPWISGNIIVLKIPREFRADADRLLTRLKMMIGQYNSTENQ